jgi:hypothetical protein
MHDDLHFFNRKYLIKLTNHLNIYYYYI